MIGWANAHPTPARGRCTAARARLPAERRYTWHYSGLQALARAGMLACDAEAPSGSSASSPGLAGIETFSSDCEAA